jgi:hydrogenase maturation factor HypF (carbamoyltransferase family)
MDMMTTHSYNHLRTNIPNLENDSLKELLKIRDYFFITNSRIEYHLDRRMLLNAINNTIRQDLAYIEKIIAPSEKRKQKPKGQKFIPIDPYGEENWEE